jgi:hypothetical protein
MSKQKIFRPRKVGKVRKSLLLPIDKYDPTGSISANHLQLPRTAKDTLQSIFAHPQYLNLRAKYRIECEKDTSNLSKYAQKQLRAYRATLWCHLYLGDYPPRI